MATVLKVLAAVVLLAGGFYLYLEFDAFRAGAVSPLGYLIHIVVIVGLAMAFWIAARRIDRRNAQANEIAGTFDA